MLSAVKGPAIPRRRVLTVGQAAKMLGTAARTVAKWVDNGRLKGFRLPSASEGHGDRRILPEDLADFCRANRVPVPPELAEPLLVVACLTVPENDPVWELDGVEIVVDGAVEVAARLWERGRAISLVCGCEEGLHTAIRLAALLPDDHLPRPLIDLRITPGPADLVAEARSLLAVADRVLPKHERPKR
jgi:excisionase family DNA binding protein